MGASFPSLKWIKFKRKSQVVTKRKYRKYSVGDKKIPMYTTYYKLSLHLEFGKKEYFNSGLSRTALLSLYRNIRKEKKNSESGS